MFTRLTILLFVFFAVAALVRDAKPGGAPRAASPQIASAGGDPVAALIGESGEPPRAGN